ncbi:MAG: hypothetical protein ABIR96_09670, partial [Bdellovibrionota bacterium]
MKQRLIDSVQSLKGSWGALKIRFMGLWRDDENALLFRAIAGLGVFAVVVFAGSGIVLWKSLHPHAAHIEAGASLVAAEEKHEGGAKNEGGDATTAPSIGARAIPPEISHRQDGVPEPDNDLVEPEIRSGRGLASIIPQNDEPTAPYNPFIT